MTRVTVIDIETTGMEPPAEIIEIGWQDALIVEGAAILGASGSRLFNAERGIPPETMAVHHITPSMVEHLPTCAGLDLEEMLHAAEGHASHGGAPPQVLVAHNAEFEARWFTPALIGSTPMICTYKAALRVWPDAPGHSNSVLRYWLGLDLDLDQAMPPHRAGPDAYVTAHILKALLAAGATGKEMVAWTKLPRLMPKINFGKHKGAQWHEAPADYLSWVVTRSDLDADTKWNAEQELQRRRPS